MMMPESMNQWRVWPRLMSLLSATCGMERQYLSFLSLSMNAANLLFVQYAAITGVFIGFRKFYMDTGKQK